MGTQRCTGYSRRLPALERYYRGKHVRSIKVDPLMLRISKPSCGAPEVSNQNLKQISPGIPELSEKQTEITTLYIYIDIISNNAFP